TEDRIPCTLSRCPPARKPPPSLKLGQLRVCRPPRFPQPGHWRPFLRALSAYFSKTVSPEEPPHHAVTPAPASVAVPVVVVASQTMVTIRSKPICSGRILRIANSNINAHFLPPKKSFGAF